MLDDLPGLARFENYRVKERDRSVSETGIYLNLRVLFLVLFLEMSATAGSTRNGLGSGKLRFALPAAIFCSLTSERVKKSCMLPVVRVCAQRSQTSGAFTITCALGVGLILPSLTFL